MNNKELMRQQKMIEMLRGNTTESFLDPGSVVRPGELNYPDPGSVVRPGELNYPDPGSVVRPGELDRRGLKEIKNRFRIR